MDKGDVAILLGLLIICCLVGFGLHSCSTYYQSRSYCLEACRDAAQGAKPGRNLVQQEYDSCNAACVKLP